MNSGSPLTENNFHNIRSAKDIHLEIVEKAMNRYMARIKELEEVLEALIHPKINEALYQTQTVRVETRILHQAEELLARDYSV